MHDAPKTVTGDSALGENYGKECFVENTSHLK